MAAQITMRDFWRWAGQILGPDRAFISISIIYGVAVGLLSLATPISVQMLINSVASTGLAAPLFTLAAVLFALLALQGVLNGLRTYTMELFRRRFFARMVAEITLRTVNARRPSFQDERRADLFNRYFDVMTVQKAMPSLLIGLFTIALQSAVGFVVTSFYHPFFLAFNLVVIGAVWLIWRIWSRGAVRTAIAQSHAKYEAARWLEAIGSSSGEYNTPHRLAHAMERSESVTADFVGAQKAHFGWSFAQTAAYMALYALASASLLALGGWLVIQGELSLGQLVAAELILSSIFFGISQVGAYLDVFYDLAAGLEELNLFYELEQAPPGAPVNGFNTDQNDLTFRQVVSGEVDLDFVIPAGSRLGVTGSETAQRRLLALLKRQERPQRGLITLAGQDLDGLGVGDSQSAVIVIDRPAVVEGSIREYLALAAPSTTTRSMFDAIEAVGLGRTLAALPEGLDTVIASTGWPLDVVDTMRLSMAHAVLSRPRILVLGPLFDMFPPSELGRMLDEFGAGCTVLALSRREPQPWRDGWLHLERRRQTIVKDRAELDRLISDGGDHAVSA